MATISMRYCLCVKNQGIKDQKILSIIPKTVVSFSCQSRELAEEEDSNKKKEKGEKPLEKLQVLNRVTNLVGRLKESLSPKQKGDWKDVLLMSLSFGVYVYISQKIVCAYCVWMSMLNQW